jgi:hypothetical protein
LPLGNDQNLPISMSHIPNKAISVIHYIRGLLLWLPIKILCNKYKRMQYICSSATVNELVRNIKTMTKKWQIYWIMSCLAPSMIGFWHLILLLDSLHYCLRVLVIIFLGVLKSTKYVR